ncbi:protein-glutamine gamma-glutamyltransferase [Acetanaerobacterium elongatum]|uniref:Protein-glutamine gamma-glutamyltransferase n=1 Tax=Acetanaerobacterium elongatum TaxID=258515 RepID=A0A1H0F568_9FIRM|nr:protein-glutamine gamma-glutamyltransferase [Acetanaerobacterium elongatum]SDN89731.1 protein-glutamine gamma-glutamyltransferase [Acetanaerobacterium elongatum]
MIKINGAAADASALASRFSEGSVERSIINTLAASDAVYSYASEEELMFELRLRREIINAANELHKSRLAFAVFRESEANPNYWKRTEEGGFQLKDDVLPSEAIKDIYVNGGQYATECATAMQIVYLKAILSIFGENRFNKSFKNLYLMNWHNIHPNLQDIGRMRSADDHLPGDRRYFANPDVDPETPEWQGENVIDLSNDQYYGHGMGKRSGEDIIAALNRHRREDAEEKAFLMQSVGRPNFKRLFALSSQ